ncbi:MAG: SAM-dependent chlorinase/fluorinase [Pseudomonadota bacterium]
MSIITLLTDFGLKDAYVGLMKGVMLSINPSAVIIDLTHHVAPHDLTQAAFIINSSYRYFPAGTVHVIVVDPGVGSRRSIVVVRMMGHTFLAPDNGILTLLIDKADIDAMVRVENSDYFLESVSQTFHGRDIFAPVGAHISLGIDLNVLGMPIANKNGLVRMNIPKPYVSGQNELVGSVISIDRFGNCITNIDSECLERFCRAGALKKLQIVFRQSKIDGVSKNYESAGPQSPLAVIGSSGYLEIAVNCGSARRYFGIEKGDSVRLIISDQL